MSPKLKGPKGPKFAKCNECKLVFTNGSQCKQHALRVGHTHKPAYACTLCFAAFKTRRRRQRHIEETGHAQQVPTTYAKVYDAVPRAVHRVGCSSTTSAATSLAQAGGSGSVLEDTDSGSNSGESSDDESSAPVHPPSMQQSPSKSLALHADGTIGGAEPIQLAQGSTVSSLKVSPNPVRCNECKLVCTNVGTLQQHAQKTGHAHKPMYFCSVCLVQFDRLGQKKEHVRSTGHYSTAPAVQQWIPATTRSSAHTPQVPAASFTFTSQRTTLEPPTADPPAQSPGFAGVNTAKQAQSSTLPQAFPVSPAEEDAHCIKCNIAFPSPEDLQAHYDESPLHPTCRDCGVGFAAIGPWAMHRARCPPPGSTIVAKGGIASERGAMRLGAQAEEIEHEDDLDLIPEGSRLSTSEDELEDPSHSVQKGDLAATTATTGGSSDLSMSTEPSDVFSLSPTSPDTPKPQRVPSSVPSESVASTASASSNAPSSSGTRPLEAPFNQQVDKVYQILQGKLSTEAEPDTSLRVASKEEPHRDANAASDAEAGSPATTSIPTRHPPPATSLSSTSFGGRTLTGPVVNLGSGSQHPTAAATPYPRPSDTNRDSNAARLSFHCRSCLRDPCVEPVATVCGHLFCHRCIVEEISTKMCCPVCQRTFLVRLHVNS